MIAASIGPGDEVITTPFCFVASANCILFVDAKPVFVDIDPKTLNIDVDQARGRHHAADQGDRRRRSASATPAAWSSSNRSPSGTS